MAWPGAPQGFKPYSHLGTLTNTGEKKALLLGDQPHLSKVICFCTKGSCTNPNSSHAQQHFLIKQELLQQNVFGVDGI